MKHIYWCIGHELLIENINKAEGCYLYDTQGKKYIDLESGVWCTPLGHSHPRVVDALENQANKISHTGYCYSSLIVEEAAKEILNVSELNNGKCVFLSSGSEAVEFGVQALRKLISSKCLLTLQDSFLGSYGSAGKRNEDEWHLFDWTSCSSCVKGNECDMNCSSFKKIPFDSIGGFVFEPGSSSGLVRFPPIGLIKNIVKCIKDNNGYIQVNEVTTGIGRTGEWFGFQHYDFLPDIISIGKGLGNGYPVSSIAMSLNIIDSLIEKGFYYSQSHQNDPLGCSVAKEVINVIKDENLIERSKVLGNKFKERLIEISKRNDLIKEVRGRGMMLAIEFNENSKIIVSLIFNKLIEKGFILARRPDLNVFRIDPPLIIDENVINSFLNEFEQILEEIN